MKKISFLLVTFILFSFTKTTDSLTEKERTFAVDYLLKTQNAVFASVEGLSAEQLQFKADPGNWSVEDCVKHMAESEKLLWQTVEGALKEEANPGKRSEVKLTDEQVIQLIESREKKIKTFSQLEPPNTPFKSLDEALESFKNNREKLIGYVKTTDNDLRNHFASFPFGTIDCYQLILFIGGHSDRHRQQIDEVKADPGFPKE